MRYDTMILDPIWEMLLRVFSFIPTLFIGLFIMVVGGIVAHLVSTLIHRAFVAIDLDRAIDKLGGTRMLKTGGIKSKPSQLLSTFIHWIFMVIVLLTTVKAVGLTMVTTLLDTILGYIPSVITGAVVLIIGMLIAKVVSGLVYVVARNMALTSAKTIARVSKYAILLYVTVVFLKELGIADIFVGTHYTIFIGGLVFALALSFGLAGKDVAAKYLHFLKNKE